MSSQRQSGSRAKIVLFANTDWYLYNFRLSLAQAIRAAGQDVLLVSPPGPYGEKLKALGFDWRPISMIRRSLNPLAELELLLALTRLFRRERPDLVHGFTIKCVVYGSFAARLAGIKAQVSAVAGLGYVFIGNEPGTRLLRQAVRALLSLALGSRGNRLIVQNDTDRRQFLNEGLAPASRIRLIPGSGVDCDRFRPRASPRRAGPLRVLLSSRLLWDKGIDEFVKAAEQLSGEGRDIDFVVAGAPDPGNPASISPDIIENWTKRGVIRWAGHVEDMPSLLADADVIVLPSYREGLSKSLIEAAACGKALITTDVPGCRDVVRHEESGLLVPPRTSAPLAAAIARLDDDRNLMERLGEAARRRALSDFAEPMIISQTFDVYRDLLPGFPTY
jgi:glycosyltransferase involved in cell wall biosynthesis